MKDEQASGATECGSVISGESARADLVGETRQIPEADQLAEFGAPDGADAKLVPGEKLGRYVVVRQLAVGGMSVVYVARDPELDREVALKVMRPGGPEGDAASSDRLLREAQAMARLSHVNVVHIYDVGVVGSRVYMAMEFIRGDTFEEWLAAGSRAWRDVVDVLVRAGRGLAAAHAVGLVHLDFKPRNVLVGDDGEVRVVDFGLARPPRSFDSGGDNAPPVAEDESVRDLTISGRFLEPITQYGTVMGTPGYMAAEQLSAEAADARSDQFAFCVTAWVALYGVRPFAGDTAREINHSIVSGSVQAPPTSRTVPVRIRRLLERGLRSDPDRRHESLDVLLDALEVDRARLVRRAAAGMGVLALVAVSGYGLAQTKNAGPSCDGGDELLAGVWDAARRDAVSSAIRADGRDFAAHVADVVTASLDDWTTGWLEMYRDSCAATHVRGEQSAALLDLRTRCLRRHLSEVRALTDTLLVVDPTTVEHATSAVGRLATIEACADVDRLATAMPTLSPEEQTKVDAVFDRTTTGIALQRSGKYAQALVLLLEAELAAELLKHDPLTVFARQSVGSLFMEIGDSEAAESMLTHALYAAEAGGLDDERLSIATELVFVLGLHRGKFERSHQMAAQASALCERLDVDPNRRSRVLANEGAVFGAQGRTHESIAQYAEALALQSEILEPEAGNLASVHLGLGAAYHLLADYERGLSHFEKARVLLLAEYGEGHPRTATPFENIGAAYQAMGRFEEAKTHFERAQRISSDALVTESSQSTLLIGLAAAYEGLEQYDEAAAVFERVIDTLAAEGLETAVLAVAMGNLAGVYVETKRYEDALALYGEQLPLLARVTAGEHIYSLYFRVGKARALRGLGKNDEALLVVAPVVENYWGRPDEIDPLHRGEAILVLARALHGLGEAKPSGEAAQRIAATKAIKTLLREARTALQSTGRGGERSLRRVRKFERVLRKQEKAERSQPQ
ncbi:MAG: tetratricopeptide repeat protein [Nannocystaceae bacterium]|nr:tetratricopeptide repeat protein [Nannocystaceae bacterium]